VALVAQNRNGRLGNTRRNAIRRDDEVGILGLVELVLHFVFLPALILHPVGMVSAHRAAVGHIEGMLLGAAVSRANRILRLLLGLVLSQELVADHIRQ